MRVCAACGCREPFQSRLDNAGVAYCKKCWDKWEVDESDSSASRVEAKALQGASIRVSAICDGNGDSRWSGWSGWSGWSSSSRWCSEQSSNDSGWSGWRSASGDVPWRSDEQDRPATIPEKSSEACTPERCEEQEAAVTAMQAADHYSFRTTAGTVCSLEGIISFF